MRNLKKKKLFPNISVVSAILYILSLEKQFIKNCLYYKFWKKERFYFSEAVVRNYSVRKIGHRFLSKFTFNLIIKET